MSALLGIVGGAFDFGLLSRRQAPKMGPGNIVAGVIR
jgi:hypothetical protein